MAKYEVIGKAREVGEGDQKKTVFDSIELINTIGVRKGQPSIWDPGSQVTEKQVADDIAKQLVEAGELKVIEAPESWAEKPAA